MLLFPIKKNSKYTFNALLGALEADGLFSDILNKGNTLYHLKMGIAAGCTYVI
jgi:hypothetical protein